MEILNYLNYSFVSILGDTPYIAVGKQNRFYRLLANKVTNINHSKYADTILIYLGNAPGDRCGAIVTKLILCSSESVSSY